MFLLSNFSIAIFVCSFKRLFCKLLCFQRVCCCWSSCCCCPWTWQPCACTIMAKISLFICRLSSSRGYPLVAVGEGSVNPFSWELWLVVLLLFCFWIFSLFCLISRLVGVCNPCSKSCFLLDSGKFCSVGIIIVIFGLRRWSCFCCDKACLQGTSVITLGWLCLCWSMSTFLVGARPCPLLTWHSPVLGGSKSRVLQTNVCWSTGFLTKFHIGCSTNCTATEKKHVCNVWSL